MKCKAIHKNLIFYLDNELPDDEMQEIGAHLTRCPECAAFAEEMKKTLAVEQRDSLPQVSPFFYTRLKARMEREELRQLQETGFSFREKVLQPALFAVLLLAGIYTGVKIGSHTATERTAPESIQAEVVPYLNEMNAEPLESFLIE